MGLVKGGGHFAPKDSEETRSINSYSNMIWIDCHNHLHFPRMGEACALIAAMRGAGVVRCVVNATCEDEWEAVATLAQAYPEMIVPAFGIHPWHAAEADGQWQGRLAGWLEEFPQAGLGECGLDRGTWAPGVEVQWPVFLAQVRLARQLQRFLTIHCVRAWGLLLEALAEEAPPPRFLVHGFAGSVEIARRLLPLGAYFSFSGEFLQARRAAVLNVFRQLPPERILLEPDAPDMLPPPAWVSHPLPDSCNHPANLPAIGSGLATALGMPAAALAELTTKNARECFGRYSR